MKLVYIENKSLLTKIITYFDYGNIEYTTDINDLFDVLIIAQYNKKTASLMSKAKKIIFIDYLEEIRIKNNFTKKNRKAMIYINNMKEFFSKCNIIITSLPYIKKIINIKKTYIIPYENLCIGVCKNKFLNFKKKTITIIDSNYKYLNTYFDVFNKFPNYNYELIGYNANLNKKDRSLLIDIPKNLTLRKYCNDRLLQNYIENSFLIIFFDDILENETYLNVCLNLKKNILLLNSDLCDDYFIDNKNIYLFNLDNFIKKINKIIKNRVCNLGNEGYNLIKDNTFEKISDKFCKLLK